jgi:hypothetical protein
MVCHQFFVLQQGRTAPRIADFLDRAAHVDIDDLGAALDVEAGAIGQILRIGTGDLHGFRLHLARVVGAARALFRGPQTRIRSRHFRYGIAGAQLFAQLTERTIRHTRHGSDENVVAQDIRTDLHWNNCSEGRNPLF